MPFGLPNAQGLYHPQQEHSSCGVGFVANVNGEKTHTIIEKGIEILVNLTHRGAAGSDQKTGDGAGILMQMPDIFFQEAVRECGFKLPVAGKYAVGVVFLPQSQKLSERCRKIIENTVLQEGQEFLGWRQVPVNKDSIGAIARSNCPDIQQFFVAANKLEKIDFERKLYVIRRCFEKEIASSLPEAEDMFAVSSLSSQVLNYKGMMLAHQVPAFYPDLNQEAMKSALAVVHQRYSTNTFPSWSLAQPFRMVAHNGEINTLRGNINNMKARYKTLKSEMFGNDLKKILPIINENGSDSACFDNLLELLVLSGRSLPHAMLMMVPEAWGVKYYMGSDRRAFCEYHSMFMEPWDGPAALVGTDGISVCAILDRNGLRPARYTLTKSGMIVLASETGVLDIPAEEVAKKGRLSPGLVLLVDTESGRILFDEAVKAIVCRRKPYRRWLKANRIELRGLFGGTESIAADRLNLVSRQQVFGYTREDLEEVIMPMTRDGKEPIASMGDDTPLAVLSDRPQLLFNYFKQLFAQVTNPPIDSIREDLVMSLTTYLGKQGNLLTETPEHARMLKLCTPILTNEDVARIRVAEADEFCNITLDATFAAEEGEAGLDKAVEQLCLSALQAASDGCSVIILSDRAVSKERAPVPSLLAASAVNLRLTTEGIRTSVSIIVESGEPWEVMHFALLLGFGATAINPYLAMESIVVMLEDGILSQEMALQDALEHYIKAIEKGLLKIFSKMGISTLRSYRGAQIFEVLGLSEEFVQKYFTNTPTRIGGIGIEGVAREVLLRHSTAFQVRSPGPKVLDSGGRYTLRRQGERHMWNQQTISLLQQATRKNDFELYRQFAKFINEQDNRHCTLRSLLTFKPGKSVPLEEVEPAAKIMRRFISGAMSFGSISREAHETIAIALNRIGSRSNSGEGGEDPARFKKDKNGDSRCSGTKQVASGRFGVSAQYLVNARELQIKIAQGAKPGEGGQLPGHKVNVEIASVRYSTPGVSLISPPPHHDIYSIEDLAQLIFDLKNINPQARINVKLVSEVGVGTIAAGVAKGHADAILISGGDGGTGASPISSIKYAGVPLELGLSEVQQVLVMNDLRGRVRLQTDGQVRTGKDLAVAMLLGAEEVGFATSILIVLGCVMMRKCHKNTCPVGIATQDSRLRKRFTGQPEHLLNFFNFLAEDLRLIMAELGFCTVDAMVGQADRLLARADLEHWKAKQLNLQPILYVPKNKDKTAVRKIMEQEHNLSDVFDQQLIKAAQPALQEQKKVELDFSIRNVNRSVGTMLSGEIARRFGAKGLADDTIVVNLVGSAGQSYGAFGAKGLTLRLNGDANDYVGKGLSGARLIVRPQSGSTFVAATNAIVGNVALYGATGGEVYLNGTAGERFAIRNSGAHAVVEGVGDHGCEYMTGGVVVVLGNTGVNFAAGMSGGMAFVLDQQQHFDLRCNLDMVDLESVVDPVDEKLLRSLVETHVGYTGSPLGNKILDNWEDYLTLFVKVMPIEYRRALGRVAKIEENSRKTEAEVVVDG